jgi:hypothetical protein
MAEKNEYASHLYITTSFVDDNEQNQELARRLRQINRPGLRREIKLHNTAFALCQAAVKHMRRAPLKTRSMLLDRADHQTAAVGRQRSLGSMRRRYRRFRWYTAILRSHGVKRASTTSLKIGISIPDAPANCVTDTQIAESSAAMTPIIILVKRNTESRGSPLVRDALFSLTYEIEEW